MATMATTVEASGITIEPMTSPEDIVAGFDVTCAGFGTQTQDGMWMAWHPGWDTPQGRQACAQRMINRWRGITKDRNGDPNTVFLKATAPSDSTEGGPRRIVGFAIWVQLSVVDGYGDKPVEDVGAVMDLNELYPGQPSEQDYLRQLDRSFHGQRTQVVKEKASSPTPAVYALDLCAVDPAYQNRGIAKALGRWGMGEAQRRGGGMELVTEASIMGRRAYEKLGFKQQGPEIVFEVDSQFASRSRPSIVFMRTGDNDVV